MPRHLVLHIILLLLFAGTASAYPFKKLTPTYVISPTKELITIDGHLNEAVWQTLRVADSFHQNFPSDTTFAQTKTEVRLTYDNDFIYIGVICYEKQPGSHIIQSLKRDFNFPRNDNFTIYLDPLNDKQNGFTFAVTPAGVQREGILTNGGNQGTVTTWDNKWFSEVKIHEDKWVAEIAIPFKSIRYDPQSQIWGLNLSRQDLKINENATWSPVGRAFNVSTLGFAGKLVWEQPPPPAGRNISVIPYIRTNYTNPVPNNELKVKFTGGGDAKIGVTSSLNLDVTVNPDFSEADVDEQVINLERFSIFFPERRQFFQENSDLFSNFGFSKIRPFFSRRIGLYSGYVVPILAGARLSGKLDANWRIGAMSIQTKAEDELNLLSQNYTVAALQRQVGKASNIAFIGVNRQAFRKGIVDNDYNRLAGIDYNFATVDNRWRGKLFYHQSFSPVQKVNPYAHASWVMHLTKKYEIHWNHEYVGQGYSAEVGFVPRLAYWRLEPSFNYYFYPKKSIINRMGPATYLSLYTDLGLNITDYLARGGYRFEFNSTSTFQVLYTHQFIKLFAPFDVSGTNQKPHPAGSYNFDDVRTTYTSNYRKLFYYEAYMQYGSYYTGNLLQYGGLINWRWQPYLNIGIKADRSEITLPQPYANSYLTLFGPRLDVSFTRSLFFTTWVQYNNQISNININSRLQWRFKPMSDLFIVYNRNMHSNELGLSNESLIVKLNWWINL